MGAAMRRWLFSTHGVAQANLTIAHLNGLATDRSDRVGKHGVGGRRSPAIAVVTPMTLC
jgi:hypothetical protein